MNMSEPEGRTFVLLMSLPLLIAIGETSLKKDIVSENGAAGYLSSEIII